MVEARDQDLVALAELAGRRAREREVERGHARAEDRLVGRASEPFRGCEARVGDERVGAPARLEVATRVGVGLAQVRRDRVDHLVRHLRPAGPVEEREPRAERREAPPNGLDVEGNGAHDGTVARPFTRQR